MKPKDKKTDTTTSDAFIKWYMNADKNTQHRIWLFAKWKHGFDGFVEPLEEIGDDEVEWEKSLDDKKPIVRFFAAISILCKHRRVEDDNGRVSINKNGKVGHTKIAESRRRNSNAAIAAVEAEWKKQHYASHMVRLETIATILNISETEVKKRLADPEREESLVLKPERKSTRDVRYDGFEAAMLELKMHYGLWSRTRGWSPDDVVDRRLSAKN